mmetsp:Transcript_9828/g.19192  ORF Transcript_9828/g.19192 Transcript_9828/m.19192 type:complete len:270 (-) Transcript_9828:539-1348(-)
MPSYWIFLPVVMVSPMEKAPGLTKPTMSPGYAFSIVSRRCANSFDGAERRTVFPVLVCKTCMSFSNRPEQTRTKAMRSRCFGSMLACSLKTNPLNSGDSGSISPSVLGRPLGVWLISMNLSRKFCTPKLLKPEPNQTGVCFCARTFSRSNGSTISSRISTSSLSCTKRSSGTSSSSLSSITSSMLSSSAFFAPAAAFVYSTTLRASRSYTPTNRSPDPMGHVTGNGTTLSVCSMVSRSSRGSRAGRSILLMKVKSGSFFSLTTSKSLRV